MSAALETVRRAFRGTASEQLRSARDAAVVLAGGLAVWLVIDPGAYDMRILTQMTIFALAAIGLNVLVGYGGIVSVGHAVFMGIGGYAWARLAESAGPGAIVVGVVIAIVVGTVLGWVCLRFRGYYLAIATLAFGLIALVVMENWKSVTGGDEGLRDLVQLNTFGVGGTDEIFLISLLLFAAFLYLQNVFRASPIGTALVTARWNEELAGAVGISIRSVRVIAFVLSAVPACIAGAMTAQLFHYTAPQMFDVSTSINLIAIPIIAGRGWRWAPLIGAAIVIALPEYVRFLQDYRLMVYGSILVLIALFLPNGLRELLVRARSLVSRRRFGGPPEATIGEAEAGSR